MTGSGIYWYFQHSNLLIQVNLFLHFSVSLTSVSTTGHSIAIGIIHDHDHHHHQPWLVQLHDKGLSQRCLTTVIPAPSLHLSWYSLWYLFSWFVVYKTKHVSSICCIMELSEQESGNSKAFAKKKIIIIMWEGGLEAGTSGRWIW